VALLARSLDQLERVAAEIEQYGRRAWPRVCDVTDRSQVDAAFEALPRVDVLVTSAGTNMPAPFLEVTEAQLDTMLALNVKGVFLTAQAAARRMRERGGAMVHISSTMGHVGLPSRTVYCATKHAVEGMTKAMAVELAPYRIRVNAIAPTFIETPLTRPFLADTAFRTNVLGRIPLGHVGQVEDVMGAVVFLASPAAAMITGASLLIDGGWTAQ
jgi:NAD(P)-dependent dehydrogenase (short-subunit alcohol dehydrogenase family)